MSLEASLESCLEMARQIGARGGSALEFRACEEAARNLLWTALVGAYLEGAETRIGADEINWPCGQGLPDGTLCGKPGVKIDPRRGITVCGQHVQPAERPPEPPKPPPPGRVVPPNDSIPESGCRPAPAPTAEARLRRFLVQVLQVLEAHAREFGSQEEPDLVREIRHELGLRPPCAVCGAQRRVEGATACEACIRRERKKRLERESGSRT